MEYPNFLMNVYFGDLDQTPLQQHQGFVHDEKTKDIIAQFLDLSRQYPARSIEDAGRVPEALLEKLKTIKFFGLNIAAPYGGLGLSLRQYLMVAEVVATNNMDLGFTALAHLSIGTKGLVLFGTEEQKQKYLPKAASGDMIFSFALTEPKTGSDAQHIETWATLSEDGQSYILNGTKAYITNANYADAMTVFAQLDPANPGHLGAFVVETTWEGVKIGKEIPKMGLKASSTAAVYFKNVRVPKENMIGKPGEGFKIAMTILNYGRLALGAASAGLMGQSLKDMLKRSGSRKQFGVPIHQFELIQEMMVRAEVNGFISSSMTAFAASMLEKNPLAAVAIESSHCKMFGTTKAWGTIYDALQMAGGSGYLSTHPYEKRMRDFRVTTIFEGTTEIHSMYPALYAIRSLTKKMQNLKWGKLGPFAFLVRTLLVRSKWDVTYDDKTMRKALRIARGHARQVRTLMVGGVFFFGRRLLQKQFLLRRITYLSIYLFGLLAALAQIESIRKTGKDCQKEMQLLAFFTEEARLFRKHHSKLFVTRKERLHNRIIGMMLR
jgi:acyl-CoA dehydrogenase family protein 9